jgi:hypothetical protein
MMSGEGPSSGLHHAPRRVERAKFGWRCQVKSLVEMRTVREVESCVGIWKHESGRIDIDAPWHRFTSDQKIDA